MPVFMMILRKIGQRAPAFDDKAGGGRRLQVAARPRSAGTCSQGLKPFYFGALSAWLNPCPDTKAPGGWRGLGASASHSSQQRA